MTLIEVKKLSEGNHNYNSDLDEVIRQVKDEFKSFLTKRRELIIKLGQAFERTVSNTESICEEIKNVLGEEIAQRLISIRDIERYCLDKWKRKTRPKKERIDKMSISEVERQDIPELLVRADGSTVTERADVTNSNPDNDNIINNERYNIGTRCIDDGSSDIQLNDANGRSSSLTSSSPQLLEQDEIKEFETKIARLQQDLASKSDENLKLQSQVGDLKSKLELGASGDRFIDVQFQVPFEDLRAHMSSSFSRNNAISKVSFSAKVDVVNRKLTDIQIGEHWDSIHDDSDTQ